MFASIRTPIATLALAGAALVGCHTSTDDLSGSCQRFTGKYPVEYAGGALGEGELDLIATPDRPDLLQASLRLWDDTGTGATLQLAGPGTCDQNVVHLTFGSGDHPDARVRVIGGTATLVPPRDRIPMLFGVWDVKVVVKANDETRSLNGFIRQREAG